MTGGSNNPPVVFASRTCVITADVLVLLVIWVKTYSIKRGFDQAGVRSPLTSLLLRDGTMYFVALLILNAINLSGNITNVFSFTNIFMSPSTTDETTDSRLSSEVSRDGRPAGWHHTSLRFASFVGNMGADLDGLDFATVTRPGVDDAKAILDTDDENTQNLRDSPSVGDNKCGMVQQLAWAGTSRG
ncbi:hypothetical protein OBBRIDRAFT_839422 [Obba rivulosa]|uniref:Uncharacterized protein n=1 Tax=Obba rivulosa TaxID=1052685 RepID=A0A8E2DJK0_9APHY|nr:hypothetical protein OBBRIDRAFT_839422 [Obba rivulosa]